MKPLYWTLFGDSFIESFLMSRVQVLPATIPSSSSLGLMNGYMIRPTKVHTVDGSEIRRYNQLRLVVYTIIDRALYIPGGAGFLPSTVVHSLT